MKLLFLVPGVLFALSACVDEPTTKTAEKAAATINEDAEMDAVKNEQLSIEQAAEKATKLIEEDAKAETEAMQSEYRND